MTIKVGKRRPKLDISNITQNLQTLLSSNTEVKMGNSKLLEQHDTAVSKKQTKLYLSFAVHTYRLTHVALYKIDIPNIMVTSFFTIYKHRNI